jgi:predicted Zn-dependent peptidase
MFKDEVDNTLEHIEITKEDFERIKKVWISVVVRSLDNKEHLAYSVVDDIINNGTIDDQLELINELDYNELVKVINKLDISNKSFVLMLPKD